ncbi:MAG: hypothetical protein JRF51_00125 [Deltaproteobacteria bacterium]|nr:hypothetical protein [Deltaproteobacteria bacterium]
MLWVKTPSAATWTAQVKFEMPSRLGRTHCGLVLWNGREERPADTREVQVAASYRDSCTSGPKELSRHPGNSGTFVVNNTTTKGRLRIFKSGNSYRFAFRAPNVKGWQDLGKLEATVKDGFKRVGMFVKTWGSEPVEVSFNNFIILPGAWD